MSFNGLLAKALMTVRQDLALLKGHSFRQIGWVLNGRVTRSHRRRAPCCRSLVSKRRCGRLAGARSKATAARGAGLALSGVIGSIHRVNGPAAWPGNAGVRCATHKTATKFCRNALQAEIRPDGASRRRFAVRAKVRGHFLVALTSASKWCRRFCARTLRRLALISSHCFRNASIRGEVQRVADSHKSRPPFG
jgi:hypothetical protein